MVEDFDFEELAGADEIAGHFDVGLGWLRLATRVIVLCDVPSYVHGLVGTADRNAASTTKGLLWMRLIRLSKGSLILPSAR